MRRASLLVWRISVTAALLACIRIGVDARGDVGANAAQNERLGAVTGLVTNAFDGSPLKDVDVTLLGGVPQRAYRGKTNQDGHYELSAIAPGEYRATFAKVGFVTLQFGQVSAFSKGRVFRVTDGARVANIGVALPQAGAIQGRVVDPKGKPVADATVEAFRVRFVEGARTLVRVGQKATSDVRGDYRIFPLDSAEYYVAASIPAPSPQPAGDAQRGHAVGYSATFHPNTANIDEARGVGVTDGQNVTAVDISLQSVNLAKVSGTVVTAPGSVDGALITLVRIGIDIPQRVTTFTESGKFQLSGIGPGRYVLQVRALPNSVVEEIARTGRSSPLSTSRDVQYGVLPIDISGHDVDSLVVQTALGGVIKGRISLHGESYTGKGLSVTAYPADEESVAAGATAVRVGESGRFEIGGVLGRFLLRLNGLPEGLSAEAVTLGGADVIDSGVSVRAGEEVGEVSVEVANAPTKLTVRTSVDAKAIGGCRVLVFSTDQRLWTVPATRYIRVADCEDGAAELVGLVPGTYNVIALLELQPGTEHDSDLLRSLAKSTRSRSISVKKGNSQTVQIPPPS